MNSRKALHEKQINEIKAAAGGTGTPRKGSARLDDLENADPGSGPGTPGAGLGDGEEAFSTPMKRVPILANFEEWMKMATDNKINAANSWNFALIDYFHDMSLLKEGEGINFQKASFTLDGCVKIYTNRVDSVATETGKLLSGLADSNNKKKDRDGEDGDQSDEELDEDGNVKKKPKKKVRHACSNRRCHVNRSRRKGHPRQLWHRHSARCSSRSLSSNLASTHCSRRHRPILTRAVPRDFCSTIS